MPASAGSPILLGRYELHAEIASGGMASVHLAALVGAVGFARVVAIKRLHPHLAKASEFVDMFLDEARLAARIRHPNVVATLDVVHDAGELFLVMEYLEGDSIAGLVKGAKRLGERIPLGVAVSVVAGALRGLQAAHEAKGLDGEPLGVVHRDISPQNILVGVDGVARVVDFGIALANVRLQTTREGQIKGKLSYMAPEQLTHDERPSPASDIYAVGVVLWEMCAGARAFQANSEPALLGKVLSGAVPRLERVAPWVPAALADVAHRAMQTSPSERFESAREMALALEAATASSPAHEVGSFVERAAREVLVERRARVTEIERGLSSPLSRGPMAGLSRIEAARFEAATPVSGKSPALASSPARSDVDTATGHTVATPPSARLPAKRRAPWFWIGGVAALIGGASLAWSAIQRGSPSEPRVLAAPSGETSAAPTASAPPVIVVAAQSASSVEAPPVNSGETLPKQARSASSPHPQARGRTPARGGAKDSCDPPYYIDEAGIQRVKRACFGR